MASWASFSLSSAQAADDLYASCSGLNDYLSYSKCVAEIDARKNGQTVAVEADQTQDGAFSLKIGTGAAEVNTLDVTLNMTASEATKQLAIAKDSNFGFVNRLLWAPKKNWRLDDLPGETQYVYVKFLDEAGTELKILSASVIYTPQTTDKAAEKQAALDFKTVYKRTATSSALDKKVLQVMAYGLPAGFNSKDAAKEKSALSKFNAAFKHLPKTTGEWRIVHALAYAEGLVSGTITVPVLAPEPTEVTTTETVTTPSESSSGCQVNKKLNAGLTIGSKGEMVKSLQAFLVCQNLMPAETELNGVFDDKVEEGVKKFQEQHKLACKDGSYCGYVGPATVKKLLAVSVAAPVATADVVATVAGEKISLNLTRNLTVGLKGEDVTALQKFLALDKELYPEGKVTGYFGPATEAAVKKFQEKYNLTCKDGTFCGYIGAATRQKLMEIGK